MVGVNHLLLVLHLLLLLLWGRLLLLLLLVRINHLLLLTLTLLLLLLVRINLLLLVRISRERVSLLTHTAGLRRCLRHCRRLTLTLSSGSISLLHEGHVLTSLILRQLLLILWRILLLHLLRLLRLLHLLRLLLSLSERRVRGCSHRWLRRPRLLGLHLHLLWRCLLLLTEGILLLPLALALVLRLIDGRSTTELLLLTTERVLLLTLLLVKTVTAGVRNLR